MARILIVDDDETMRYSLRRIITSQQHETLEAGTLAEGLRQAGSGAPDLVFLDVHLPDGNSLPRLVEFRRAPSAPEIVIITGYGDADGAELAIANGAWDYIEKAASLRQVTLTLERALQYRKACRRPEGALVRPLQREDIVGDSAEIKACLETVAQAAGSDASVLITGETGTGKELFARAIHDNSTRASGPFVVVDCAALPQTLVESLLFGHQKGAFTGAERDREGLVQAAHGGTLFLDEVGELPLELQKAFLRVLQEKKVRPLGSAREVVSDFRLVAATNRNLERMAADGGFRSDLLFRLKGFVLELPPLRRRRGDIRSIAQHCIDRYCDKHRLGRKGCLPDFFELLEAHDWPGNVRELLQTLEQALTVGHQDPFLFARHLPVELRARVTRSRFGGGKEEAVAPAAVAPTPGEPRPLPPFRDFRNSAMAAAERQYLQDLMQLAGHDVSRACELSGLSQSRLYALLKERGIPTGRAVPRSPAVG